MILTKDNLLRFVVDNKFVTPTDVSEKFETSTMIASAALSGLSKDKLVAITNLKLGSSPYYYDPKQPESLIEIGEKHLKNHEKEIFIKLKTQQIVNDGALPIAEKLAAERLMDFSIPLELDHDGKHYKFWIWYLRDINDTRNQILIALGGESEVKLVAPKPVSKIEVQKEIKKLEPISVPLVVSKPIEKKVETVQAKREKITNPFEVQDDEPEQEDKIEAFIKDYFKKNYLKIDGKKTTEKFVKYNLSLKINELIIKVDAVYFPKKPTDSDILKFYMSGNKPKIVFIENAAKKHFKLTDSLDNLEIVNI
jgi:hypothetical protein